MGIRHGGTTVDCRAASPRIAEGPASHATLRRGGWGAALQPALVLVAM
ncbi:hypothetical protein FM114_09310 [Luteococcus japonicus LSP_Lj1]|uniref:Uncharacterized protein n=1 Tax=Luteococcus japonicus LSP_Lj1 TaxID=1255658 RepID=A0A1R4JSR8_9ACTN|nr:hypothetical protein FM114_09310 [Luteococcus japonicus LSP_Lj1]